MPKYFTFNSKFTPYSYDELIKPVLDSTKAHQDIEDKYSELETKAAIWEKLANNEKDKEAYDQYKTYANDLKTQADNLLQNGLNAHSRRDFQNIKRRYASEITPIELAFAKREELIKEQRAANRDGMMMFERHADKLSLKELQDNMQLNPGSISGTTVMNMTAAAAKKFATQVIENPEEFELTLGGQYYARMFQMGYSMESIIKAILNDPSAAPYLMQIKKDVYNATPAGKWGNTDVDQQMDHFMNLGLWEALGPQNIDRVANRAYGANAGGIKPNNKLQIPMNTVSLTLGVNGEDPKKLAKQYKNSTSGFDPRFFMIVESTNPRIGYSIYQIDLKDLSIWNNKGNLRTREAFAATLEMYYGGLEEAEKQRLMKQYDDAAAMIKENFTTTAVVDYYGKTVTGWNRENVIKQREDHYQKILSGSTMDYRAIAMTFENVQEKVREVILPKYMTSTYSDLKYVTKVDRETGDLTLGKTVEWDDVYNKDGNLKGYASVYTIDGRYVIIQVGDKTMAGSTDKLGTIADGATYIDFPKIEKINKLKEDWISANGMDAYKNQGGEAYFDNLLRDAGGNYLLGMYNAFDPEIPRSHYKPNVSNNNMYPQSNVELPYNTNE